MPVQLILCPTREPLDVCLHLVSDYVFFIRAILERTSTGNFIDFRARPKAFNHFLANMGKTRHPRHVYCIPIFFANRTSSIQLLRALRMQEPLAKIIVTGPFGKLYAKEFLSNKLADIVIAYDAEFVLLSILEAWRTGNSLARIPNIIYVDKQKIRATPIKLNKDLNALPFISPYYAQMKSCAVHVQTSRGCPFSCKFCDKKHYWGSSLRFRSAENVLEELTLLRKSYAIKRVSFGDINFISSPQRTRQLCRALIQSNLKMQWNCNTRVDSVDPNILRQMQLAGCRKIYYGAESGSNRILNLIGKGQTRRDILRAIKMTRALGMKVGLYFMIGCPGETKTTLRHTLELLERIMPVEELEIAPFRFAPGSPLWDTHDLPQKVGPAYPLKDMGIILYDFNWDYYGKKLSLLKQFFALAQATKEPVINIAQLPAKR